MLDARRLAQRSHAMLQSAHAERNARENWSKPAFDRDDIEDPSKASTPGR